MYGNIGTRERIEFTVIGKAANEAARIEVAIQDLLGEDLTLIILPLLRLGATQRSPENWNAAQQNMQFMEGVDSADDTGLERLQTRLQDFVRGLRRAMRQNEPGEDTATAIAVLALEFVSAQVLRQTFTAYRRKADFDRVWNRFTTLLAECTGDATTWSEVLDEFEGLGQIVLMTIHKSKGLEFHTMIFYGLDNQTWWSLTPQRTEELNSFFVAFTRAKQRAFFTLCRQRGQAVAWIEELLAPAGVTRINGNALLVTP